MMQIKPMSNADISQIVALEQLCFSDPWSSMAFHSELHNPLSLWLVALDDDQCLMGYIGSQTVLDESDIMNVAVSPQYRKQGVATALIDSLCNALKDKSVKKLSLEVRKSNVSAISLYQKLGFIQVGLRKNYYRNPKEDALILQKEI